ncbi:2-succinyl-5-enolpyruvyl-6-hydroxy-3-cyclohexene-1-carboxylic-acid synthase [Alicyclobacillus fastidiosus]|uniref:2-succinyl-5-enolpyruvyl-6-hydroxy-3-cyclohexene-1-carboxylate synthase n=1 Tax=Alicyclobacillus fastidiosus TaxID=392011 RepID=A0ABY6ZPB1_9BACL|nr:2-succinyl-5-enolpyruvyl-6-hydroxy-3-cyclohexene-1-carboxylic-acid synthase [Alicyclobacillus fastidiosus]WAH43986.1 2-succinyl-5-enolpyruvyl-6-hydroxy-3-cyclohexene-1-carboxylic-acid synthase [Alicyclobacillus fastidiosus]GMA60258.1 2-succinyl-5-enolpyruvyl-6-hydroxy-3-cyclohexene- 1-carboxylate synthase [Alicyclobacillus fastidiosus]
MANWDLWPVHSFVDGLVAAGVRQAVISPGSRNTPLTLAFAEQPDVQVYTHMDERSAGFFALGLARSTNAPVVLCCTSGTATANYYPAVMEAFEARVPLIVVTADRPHQLRDVGANQAVRQPGMYAGHVKWALEMPVPDGSVGIARHAAAMAGRGVAVALASPCGPVHINYPFVEPLLPPLRADLDASHRVPVPKLYRPLAGQPAAAATDRLHAALRSAERPLFVLGPQSSALLARAVAAFCDAEGIPLFADVLSQARFLDGLPSSTQIAHYDMLLLAAGDRAPLPDVVVRFGAQPTSKSLAGFFQRMPGQTQVFVVDDTEWYRDASFVATDVIAGDELSLVRRLASQPLDQGARWQDHLQLWRRADGVVRAQIEAFTEEHWFEGSAMRSLVDALPANTQLFIGNSRPIRDLDALVNPSRPPLAVFGNRGVSGIDGIVSTAFGIAAGGASHPTVLCVGDVSFYHDLNGLLAARRFEIPLTVLLIHNDGGGIFQHLSQAQRSETLEYFTTPHGLDFQEITQAYGGVFTRVGNAEELARAVRQATGEQKGLQVIEVRFGNAESAALYRKLQRLAQDAVQAVVE